MNKIYGCILGLVCLLARGTCDTLSDGSLQMILLNKNYYFYSPAGKKVSVNLCMHAEAMCNTRLLPEYLSCILTSSEVPN